MTIDMNRVVVDEIFQDFVITVNLDHDLDRVIKDVYTLKHDYPSQAVSNIGGWQSPVFGPQCPIEILNQLPKSLSNIQRDAAPWYHGANPQRRRSPFCIRQR